ncbi:hypothetical protein NKG94_34310 [Micromonospora sp. M12]
MPVAGPSAASWRRPRPPPSPQHIGNEELTMHHHRKMLIAGYVTAAASASLLTFLAVIAWTAPHPPITARFVVLAVVVLLLGAISLRLIENASARARGHVEGVRETVDRLAAALPKDGR